jgi:proliferating cell nuclear antigen
LKRLVEAIKDLVTDVNIDATPTGLSLQAMDSSHVALVNLHLSMEGFEKYRADRNLTLGISITNLAKVMKLVNQNDSITLRCEDEPTYLTIICQNQSNSYSYLTLFTLEHDRTTQFNINLITLDSEHLGIPETEYTSEIQMNSAEFSKLCKELYALSETVEFEISASFVKFAVEGEIGSGSIKIHTSAGDCDETKAEDTVRLSFALRYLNLFNKAYSLSNQVKLSMAAETPLVVEYEIDNLGTLKYYLAPKITDQN